MIERIPELDYNPILPTNGQMPWYDPTTDTTYHINAQDFLSGLFDPGDAWNEFFSYNAGEIVTSLGEVWISNAGGNLGNPPGPASTFWTLEPDPAPAGGLSVVDLETGTAGIIVVSMNSEKELCFNGNAAIIEPKTWSFVFEENAILIPFIRFAISGGLHVQELPVGSKVADASNATWDSAARTWEPLAEGDYEARVTFVAGDIRWIIQGPY